MGKKGAPVVEENLVPEEPPQQDDVPLLTPPPPSLILKRLDWQVVPLHASGRFYYYSASRREARVQPPYYEILGIDESEFSTVDKAGLWKAFFACRQQYKCCEDGTLTEELKNPEDEYDWSLVMEAFSVLIDPVTRAEYDQRNIVPQAKAQLVGLRVQHEVRTRRDEDEARRRALTGCDSAESTRDHVMSGAS
eukprot:TRINITY_DN68709_c0_g1_i1.p1 TRINITY_DN68709_c0_g1~~TRINITY_DN68709_c0_g1_i1.p1  ORF type:complete len:193 (+),score=30.59 TRINITY_DN68709_c0_g1_i1:142-720(+)